MLENNNTEKLDLDNEWKKFLTKVNSDKWTSSEETCYYLAFCTGWWARNFKNKLNMNNTKEDYVSYEVAKLLHKKKDLK